VRSHPRCPSRIGLRPSRSGTIISCARLSDLTPPNGESDSTPRMSLHPSKCLSRTRRTLSFRVTAAEFPFEGGCTLVRRLVLSAADTVEARGPELPAISEWRVRSERVEAHIS
jgi:hypothetical protein